MILLLLFILGIFVGSFLNVVIDRLPRKETIIRGRSHCEFCKKELAWYDLIPLFSFLILKGKCRYCHRPIGLLYPVIEFSTGILFLATFVFVYGLNFQFTSFDLQLNTFISLVYYLIIISSFIIIFFEDLEFGIIPDIVVFPAIIITLAYLFIIHALLLIVYLSSAVLACAFFLILFLITKGKGMGFGDVKLAFLLGLILGFPKIILALYLAFLTGAFVGIILILWKKKKSIKETIPFGPFLIAGFLISLFLGNLMLPRITSFLGF
jgi:leader peptidase (prepilin peptidase)/N-methyltransferase